MAGGAVRAPLLKEFIFGRLGGSCEEAVRVLALYLRHVPHDATTAVSDARRVPLPAGFGACRSLAL